jgi:hypothetical protein
MGLTNTGRDDFTKAIIGDSFTNFSNANAYLGVGNSSTAFAAGQTDLQGASKTRKAQDATYPQRTGNVLVFKATFGAGDANHAWEEIGVFNAASSGDMLCRVVQSLGTKSGGTWVLTHTVTVTAA